jgi:hypothetical protein
MKKIFFVLSAAVWLFASCEENNRHDFNETYWYVKEYTVRSNDWQLVNGVNQLDSYYKYSFNIIELSRDIYEKGHVFCYMFQKNDAGQEVQTILPFTVPRGEKVGSTENLWTETYAYDFAPGKVTFYVNYSDFFTDVAPPTTTFRVVLNY